MSDPAPPGPPARKPKRQPPGDAVPVAQRIRIRFAKRGRLRFTSHRDIQRALERAVRRTGLPIAYSAGFTPHPKISWAGAVPTGAASECEYVEIGLTVPLDPDEVRVRLDAALPDGIDVVAAVTAPPGSLADALQAGQWEVRLPGVTPAAATAAVAALAAAGSAVVRRVTKAGVREVDVRAGILRLVAGGAVSEDAVLDLVVGVTVPVVRPDDVLAALVEVGLPQPASPPVATRLAYGTWDGRVVAPLF